MTTFPLQVSQPQPRERRAETIARELRGLIASGKLCPGDRLPTEEKLCGHFGVSRTALREAIQMLRVSGVLEVTPGRGSFVRKPEIGMIMDDLALAMRFSEFKPSEVMQARLALHEPVVRMASIAPWSERQTLQQFMVQKDHDADENERRERMWHLKMAEISGLTLHENLLRLLLSIDRPMRIRRFGQQDHLLHTMEIQIRLNGCLQEGDADLAARVMASYLKIGCGA